MAIMTRCCCCGIRQGSIACGIYSLIMALLAILSVAFRLSRLSDYKETLYALKDQEEIPDILGDLNIESFITAVKVEHGYSLICQGLVCVTSIILIQGIKKDMKDWLVPFMAAKAFAFSLYLFALILSSYTVSKMGIQYGGIGIVLILVCLIPIVIGDIVCILCVLSQYQEYRDGRGRPSDEVSLTQTDPGKQQQPAGTGGFSYQHMSQDVATQDGPPPYNAP